MSTKSNTLTPEMSHEMKLLRMSKAQRFLSQEPPNFFLVFKADVS